MLLLCRMYLDATPDTFLLLREQGLIQCLVIRSNVFFRISIYVTMNDLIKRQILEFPSRDQ